MHKNVDEIVKQMSDFYFYFIFGKWDKSGIFDSSAGSVNIFPIALAKVYFRFIACWSNMSAQYICCQKCRWCFFIRHKEERSTSWCLVLNLPFIVLFTLFGWPLLKWWKTALLGNIITIIITIITIIITIWSPLIQWFSYGYLQILHVFKMVELVDVWF